MAIRTREIYRSAPSGDRWLLALDPDTDRVFVSTSPTFPQVAKSPILRSEPFSSRLATDQRSKNSCG